MLLSSLQPLNVVQQAVLLSGAPLTRAINSVVDKEINKQSGVGRL